MDSDLSPIEKAEYLQDMLVARATGMDLDDADYKALRSEFMNDPRTASLLPDFVRSHRNGHQFWEFIKSTFAHYAERRSFIYRAFHPLLDSLERDPGAPADHAISTSLSGYDTAHVHALWSKALERRQNDPEGAITTARSLLESVCKHILDDLGVSYDSAGVELHELYKSVSWELNLSPEQHTEKVFRQILGGCSGIVSGLGTLRNRFGDAHGRGRRPIKPAARHAELAVNIAGSVAVFLIETHLTKQDGPP